MARQVRILVVDDDPRIISALHRALGYDGFSVDVAYDGNAALRQMAESPADVILLDINLPEIDGVEVCRRIRLAHEGAAIIMITARDAVSDRVRGLDTGADDYLVKPFANEELLSRVRAVLRRRPPATARDLAFSDIIMDTATREVRRGGLTVALTAREFDLLELLLRHPRQVLTREQLLEQVWGADSGATSNVVDVCVSGLRDKLEQEGGARLIHTVRGVGFVLRDGGTA